MKLFLGILSATVVVCALSVVSRTPYVLASTPVPTPGATDRDVLVALYHATGGDNWTNNENWLSDAPVGTWYGVTTDESDRVIELILWFNNLRGTIPPELGGLTALTRLDFSGNQLSGTIPTELGNLTALTRLDLDRNRLSGTVPPELGNLTNLDALYLAGNRLKGCQPAVWKYVADNDLDQLGLSYCVAAAPADSAAADRDVLVALYWVTDGDKWTNNDNWLSDAPIGTWHGVKTDESGRVIELGLWFNNLSGTIPSELGNLTALTSLHLSGNNLNGTIPTELGNLTALTSLSLFWNQLRGIIPTELDNLTALTELALGGNQLSGTIPTELGNLTALTELVLGGNQLSGTIPTELGNLTALTELALGGNQLSGTIPTELGNLTALTSLSLSGNQLSGKIPTELGNLTALTDLNLGNNQLNGKIPPELGNLTALTSLNLSGNNLSGTIPPELGDLINLDELYVSGNRMKGCLPAVWKYVVKNDLDWIGLPYCAAATSILSAAAVRDRDALVALYWATNGENWRNSDNWLTEAPIRMWHGVTTDEGGRVIELDLRENGLRGTIPSKLGNLANLRQLDLSWNRLNGTIPPDLGNLASLEGLNFWGNQLNGPIPSELGNLTNLMELHLSANQLSGTVPPELGNLTNLMELHLSANQLSGTVPPELGNLTNLMELHLSANQLSGTVLPELGNLTNLMELHLSANQLSGTVLPELGNLTNLKNLNLSENRLSGPIPPELGNLTHLEMLSLGDNELSGPIPSELSRLNKLSNLGLGDNRLSETIPSELGDLTNLEWLNLSENLLSGPIPPELGNLTHLEHLGLGGNELSGPIPSELGGLNKLSSLGLGGNRLSGTIPPELSNLTNLFWLDLEDNHLIGTVPPQLGKLTNLWGLNLSENQLSGTIPPELGKLTNLWGLNLSENQLSGTIPPELRNLTNLFWLDLEDNYLIGTVPPQLGKLTNLEVWYLSGNRLDGCLPSDWRNVQANDFDELGVIFCSALSPPLTAATDRDALIALYRSANGDDWLRNDSWLSEAPLDQWHGVTTDENGRVIELDLGENGLSGTIPSELGTLLHLERLLLHGNELRGEIPPELGNLTNLTSLSLWENQLHGTIPRELGNLTNLAELSLEWNLLHGSIPPELGNLTNLAVLWLGSNQLSGTVPPELDKLTNLLELSLLGNQIVGCVPAAWRNVVESDLEILGLPYCVVPSAPHLVAADREALIALYRSANGDDWTDNRNWLSEAPLNTWYGITTDDSGRVKKLELGHNGLSGTIPSELGTLAHLERLLLHGNELRGEIPLELGNLVNLTSLSLSENQLHGTIPRALGNLTNLAGLYLDSNQLHGTVPPELGNLTNLAVLWLDSNQLSGTVPSELGDLTNLFGLSLSGNQLGGCVPAAWRNVMESDLEELGVPYCAAPLPPSAVVPAELSSAQIFAKVSPAIAFVHTEIATGSGILIEGNYVLTNAHVVWPFHAARVVFPNGSAFDQVPLKGWDLLADVALLGPINAPTQPLVLHDGENIPISSDVYLIGYLGEVEANPQPATARGVLSRLRQWEPTAVTYFQTDTSIEGGQSGGALVSDTGDVIGISGFKISEGQFVLVASAADLLPRIRQLLAGEAPSGLGDRRLPLEGGALRHVLTSENYWDAYIVNEPAGSAIEVALSGAGDAKFRIFDLFGNEVTDTETASFDFITQSSGPHFLVFSQLSAETTTLTANRRFARFVDPDQGREILVGQSLPGNIDFPSDFDFFFLHLEKGEAVEVAARSALTDPSLGIMGMGSSEEELIVDDDSGGGLFGLDAKILFQAPYTGEYVLIIFDALGIAPGGYVISVARPQSMVVPTSQVPLVTIKTHINVRQGPGTNYPVIDTAAPGEQYIITGKNPGLGDWWQIDYKGRTAWVYAPLVTATDAENVQGVATPDP